jgi:hypothetical protein
VCVCVCAFVLISRLVTLFNILVFMCLFVFCIAIFPRLSHPFTHSLLFVLTVVSLAEVISILRELRVILGGRTTHNTNSSSLPSSSSHSLFNNNNNNSNNSNNKHNKHLMLMKSSLLLRVQFKWGHYLPTGFFNGLIYHFFAAGHQHLLISRHQLVFIIIVSFPLPSKQQQQQQQQQWWW